MTQNVLTETRSLQTKPNTTAQMTEGFIFVLNMTGTLTRSKCIDFSTRTHTIHNKRNVSAKAIKY